LFSKYGGSSLLHCCACLACTSFCSAGQPPKPPCRPGFSESFYTVFVSRDLLRGQSILKGKHCGCGGPGSHLLTGVSPSSPEIHSNQRVIECVCGRKYIMVCGIPS
uniref:Cadherin prodomain domain-containing protein n=1 Tax=Oncorhynchus mykiss TaxID=8022 RepID=A0A8K9UHS4_ONCMY